MNKYGTDKQAYNSYDGLNNTFILIMPKINSSVEVEVTLILCLQSYWMLNIH